MANGQMAGRETWKKKMNADYVKINNATRKNETNIKQPQRFVIFKESFFI
jgi:hypothetical protein